MYSVSLTGRSGGTEKSEERNRAVTTYIFLAGHPDNLTITSHRDRSFTLLNRERKENPQGLSDGENHMPIGRGVTKI